MAAETKDERRERLRLRLAELQAQEFEAATVETFRLRCTPEDVAKIEALTGPQVEALAELAGSYVSQRECPDCGSTHTFTWGIRHGAGYCGRCHWPGTAYHFLRDPDPAAPCGDCEKPPSEHVDGHSVAVRDDLPDGDPGKWTEETYLKCPGENPFAHQYQPRTLCKLVLLLWAHPSTVETS